MTNEFEPYYSEEKKNEFNVWEYQPTQVVAEPIVDIEEERKKEYELLKQEAFEKGYAEGLHKAQQEIDAKKAQLMQWIELIQNPISLLDEQVTEELLQTLLWLSKECIGVELSINPNQLKNLFAAIKEELPALKANKVLAMHPEDCEWIKSELNDKEFSSIQEIIVADSSLNRGDFYLKNEDSELDGRLQTRLATLFEKYIKG